MSKLTQRGLILAVVHLLIVGSLGGKLLMDRATRPRVWAQTVGYDPDLPIRGRYAAMRLLVDYDPAAEAEMQKSNGARYDTSWFPAHLEVRNNRLIAVADPNGSVSYSRGDSRFLGAPVLPMNAARLNEPVDFFIPEHADDPTWLRSRNSQLWAEVTIPRKGPPRPIQLAIKKDGQWTPIEAK